MRSSYCDQAFYTDRLPEYVRSELSGQEATLVGYHLTACPDCCATMEVLQRVLALQAPPPDLDLATIVRQIAPYRRSREVSSGTRLSRAMGLLAASAVLILGLLSVNHIAGQHTRDVQGKTGQLATTSPDLNSPEVNMWYHDTERGLVRFDVSSTTQ